MECAPILVFTYKRLDTLKSTVNALKANVLADQSDLFIFSDAPQGEEDMEKVAEVRKFIRTISGFKTLTINESPINKGLAASVIGGVSQVLKIYSEVIVVEDDLLTTPNFLTFMNAGLVRYRTEKKVFSISGYSFNLGTEQGKDAYFLVRGWSWGWATWKERWIDVDWQMKDYHIFKKDKDAQKRFSQGGSDLNSMLHKQMTGKIDSWAIRWFYNQFKVNGLTLYPVFSKVYNNGFDEVATNTRGSNTRYLPLLDTEHSNEFIFPDEIDVDPIFSKRFSQKMNRLSRIRSRIQNILLKLR